jgi:hypothetical protein
MLKLPKYSLGVGDRFAHQGPAQVDAVKLALDRGLLVAPVWNKSFREHKIVGSQPAEVRTEADGAVALRGWTGPYFVDADHINLKSVDAFIEASDFFTLDVAEHIGQGVSASEVADFVARHNRYLGQLAAPGLASAIEVGEEALAAAARKFLAAVREAARTFRYLRDRKGDDEFVVEVSMDETDTPQSPDELLFILAALAEEQVPVQTIAPRFSGRFNKGVDYVGDLGQFRREFAADLAVIAFAIREFGLPENLKLSVHSGSDKFSLYRPIHEAIGRHDAGIHLKTAGTTWLEELIGLAMSGGNGLEIAKEVYRQAFARRQELCAPYATVIDIAEQRLPDPAEVDRWDGEQFAAALRHDQRCPAYNPNFRQLLHVSYKVAAELGHRFLAALERCAETIASNVTENLYRRHICPLFLGESG